MAQKIYQSQGVLLIYALREIKKAKFYLPLYFGKNVTGQKNDNLTNYQIKLRPFAFADLVRVWGCVFA